MKLFVTADQHFGHREIIDYERRPFGSVSDMDSELIRRWNDCVSAEDTVVVAGDFSFYDCEKTREIVGQLNGKKILVKGNHDTNAADWYIKAGFSEVSSNPIILNDWFVVSHEPPHYYNSSMPFYYIYGHVHNTEMYQTVTRQSACVCVERWGYAPVLLEELLKRSGIK